MNIKDLPKGSFQVVEPHAQATTTPVVPVSTGKKLNIKDINPADLRAPSTHDSSVAPVVKATNPQAEATNWFDYNPSDGIVTDVAKGVGNIIPSTWGLVKGIGGAILHPVRSVKSIGNLIAGTAGAGAQYAIDHTDLGQKLLQEANKVRAQNGAPLLVPDENGKLHAPDTDQILQAKAVGGYFADRYGGGQNIAKTAVEDPAGIALDLSMLLDGGASIAGKTAKIAEVADMAKTAGVLNKTARIASKTSEVINPLTRVGDIAGPIVKSKARDVTDLFKKSGKELQADALKEGLYGMNETVGTLKNKFENTSYKYKNPAGEVVDVNPIDTMVQYDLIPQPAKGGSLDVTNAKAKIPTLKSDIEGKISKILKTDNKTVSIHDYAKQLDDSIDALDKSQMYKTELAGKIESELKTLEKAYPNGEIPLEEINKIRKEANGEYRDDKIDMARIRGNATREIVYNATPDLAVKDLLNEQRKLINAEEYMKKLAIHKVKGGRLGNYVYSTLGAIVGGATHLPFGVGETIGAVGGRGLSELLQRRQLRSLPADIKAGLEKATGAKLEVDPSVIPERVKSGWNGILGN